MKTTAFILTMLLAAVAQAQQTPTTGYAPVNGLEMYYEVHGSGDPVVLVHGSFMTITNNWAGGRALQRRKSKKSPVCNTIDDKQCLDVITVDFDVNCD